MIASCDTDKAVVNSFASALRTLVDLKAEGVFEEYALAGAMALVFWTEPVATYDLDVLIWLRDKKGPLVTLAPVYEWLVARGHAVQAEHVIISGVPVQFLPAHNALADEAIKEASELDYEGVPVRVVRPEHLIALYLEPSAQTRKRRERAAALAELPTLDQARLDDILARHGLHW
ncbi:MAG: hypothetical protein ACREUU_05455 [Gammaproteobacteria bacterium]